MLEPVVVHQSRQPEWVVVMLYFLAEPVLLTTVVVELAPEVPVVAIKVG